jgi:hypothetical protein
MPDIDTSRLGLPLIAAAQAQKHVTHNEALLALDALVQLSCLDRDLAAPPPTPADGATFIVGPAPTGAWVGRASQVAVWRDGVWRFTTPASGFVAYVVDEAALCLFDGAGWVELSSTIRSLQSVAGLGIGTLADAVNTFAAKLNAALWTARALGEGGTGDLRLTFNKEAADRVLSLLFQTGFAARAELGLVGVDDLRLRVSPDGVNWIDSFRVERASGALQMSAPLVTMAPASGGFPVIGGPTALEVRASPGASDAAFMSFHRPGHFAAYFGLDSDNELKFGGWSHGATKYPIFHAGRTCQPNLDNTVNLGSASFRFGNVFAGSGVVNSSDAALKVARGELSAAERRAWGRVRAAVFQWRDAMERKGAAGARLHAGYVAQDVCAAFAAEGLDAGRYGLFCDDPLAQTVTRTRRVSRPSLDAGPMRRIATRSTSHTRPRRRPANVASGCATTNAPCSRRPICAPGSTLSKANSRPCATWSPVGTARPGLLDAPTLRPDPAPLRQDDDQDHAQRARDDERPARARQPAAHQDQNGKGGDDRDDEFHAPVLARDRHAARAKEAAPARGCRGDAFATQETRMINFRGAATRLAGLDIARIGREIGVGEDEVRAVMDVEAAASGFDAAGRPAMLFEPHRFYRHLSGWRRTRAVRLGLAYPSWGERPYPRDSYPRLEAAMAIDEDAALRSASWGLGQIMGSNHLAAGYPSAKAMATAFCESEAAQLAATIRFIKAQGLDDELRSHNWSAFARGYNGPGYARHGYHRRLAARYAYWRGVQDAASHPALATARPNKTPDPDPVPRAARLELADPVRPASAGFFARLGAALRRTA